MALPPPNTYPIQFITSPVGEFQFSEQYNILHKIKPRINSNIIPLNTFFRCSLPKAMSISRSEIFRRKKKRPKMKKSWEIMGGQWEVMWGLWGSWEVSGGSWEVSESSWEVSEWSWEVSGRLKGGHNRSPGGCWRLVGRHCKMLIANAIAEQLWNLMRSNDKFQKIKIRFWK